jgi:hypothetical protein
MVVPFFLLQTQRFIAALVQTSCCATTYVRFAGGIVDVHRT